MHTNDAEASSESAPDRALDPERVLESVVSELECLMHDAGPGVGSDLIELHAALLVYNLEGRAELIPASSFGRSVRHWREGRVVRSARRIAARGAGETALTLDIADGLIRRHLHLIDPELASYAA